MALLRPPKVVLRKRRPTGQGVLAHWTYVVTVVAAIAVVVLVGLVKAQFLPDLSNQVFDWYQRFDHREWIATGNEPSWRLEVTARDMVIGLLGGAPAQRVPHGGPQRQDGTIMYTSADGPEPAVLIDERRCVDSQSGSLFAYSIQIRSEGRTLVGCAAHNPSMPAP